MDWIRLGPSYRALCIRLGWRQIDLAERAGVSRDVVSNIERGLGGRVSAATLARVAHALDERLDITLRWRSEGPDRLLDASHALLVEQTVELLAGDGWEALVEASFEIDGERGSIDIFAFHPPTGMLLVIEVTSVVPHSKATLHGLDRKARLAPRIAAGRGWPAAARVNGQDSSPIAPP
ncbi:MAG TPA: helix-turn-helix domain-containing protein [Candidatus Limnocylindrales bacterium]